MLYVLTVRPEARGDLAHELSSYPTTLATWVTNGGADLFMRAVFDDESAAIRFQAELFEQRERISAVISTRVVARYVNGETN